jgi:hypothetical protein
MTKEQIDHMVQRFLGWSLPETFSPDGGVSFKRASYGDHIYPMPVGTNVFTAVEATAMVKHMLDGLPETKEN